MCSPDPAVRNTYKNISANTKSNSLKQQMNKGTKNVQKEMKIFLGFQHFRFEDIDANWPFSELHKSHLSILITKKIRKNQLN